MFRFAHYRAAVAALVCTFASNLVASTPLPHEIRVFDALLYTGKPDLREIGMVPIVQLNQPEKVSDTFDATRVRETMQRIRGLDGVVFLDYEVWPLRDAAPEKIASNIIKFNQVLEIAREIAPSATVGYYGLMPCREYWGLVEHNEQKIAQWKECNRQGERIAEHVDVIFPSLYTFYDNQVAWDAYAKGMIEEARRYNKPVYVFLWPEFHVSNILLRGTNIPAKFWRHQLEFCRALADGIVIWGGWKEQWNETADWWVETKSFMKTLKQR
jgi:hypothetical protein